MKKFILIISMLILFGCEYHQMSLKKWFGTLSLRTSMRLN